MAFAGAALHLREDHHADRFLAAVGLRHRADADEGAGLHVGERRADDAEHAGLVGQPHALLVALAARLDHDGRPVDADDGADDANGLLLRLRRRDDERSTPHDALIIVPPKKRDPWRDRRDDVVPRYIGGVMPSRP